jgi:hypothetical protein
MTLPEPASPDPAPPCIADPEFGLEPEVLEAPPPPVVTAGGKRSVGDEVPQANPLAARPTTQIEVTRMTNLSKTK